MRYDEERDESDEPAELDAEPAAEAEGATGAGIALLVAPERGRVTRRRLARRVREAGEEIRDEFDGVRAAARRSLARRRRRLRRLGREVS